MSITSLEKRKDYLLALQMLPFIPILLGAVSQSIDSNIGRYFGWASLALLVIVAVAYILQLRYLQLYRNKKLKSQRILVGASFVLPLLGILIGDAAGQANYGEFASDGGIGFMAVIAGIFGLSVTNVCAMVNAYLIRPVMATTTRTKRVLRILGTLAQFIVWVSIVAASFIGGVLTESLRNPSTD